MSTETSVSALYDGKVLIPDHSVDLQAGKKYYLIIEDIPPDKPQKGSTFENSHVSETTCMSERVLAREWLTSEEDEAWDYL